MTRPRTRIGSELLPVFLILGCLAGTWTLVVSMHRRAAFVRQAAARKPVAAVAPVPKPVPPAPAHVPRPKPAPAPPAVDPTRTALARLGAEEAGQILEARAADAKADALERARLAAIGESERIRRRERLIREQVDSVAERARALDQEAEALAMERDVLAHERDATKAALARARNRASFAVLPNRAPNGTWRRPIVIECRDGAATIQPRGPSFSLLELSSLMGMRSSPIVLAVVRELIRVQGATGPDGAPAVPYIFFVIRPDGIRPYYEARARLESLGVAFGYELVDQNMQIDFPDLDHPDEWDGSVPLGHFPVASLDDHRTAPSSSRHGSGARTADEFVWTSNRPDSAGGLDHTGDGAGGRSRGFEAAPGRPLRGMYAGDQAAGARGGGGWRTPGMLPPTGGPAGSRTTAAIPYGGRGAGGSSDSSGADDAGTPPGTGGREVPREPFSPGQLTRGREAVVGLAEASQAPDAAGLDGVASLGRQAGEAPRFRSRGLKPGEPGAPPDENLGSPASGQGSSGLSGTASAGGSTTTGAQSAGGGSGSASGDPGGSGMEGGSASPRRGPFRIEVPMEIVVACGPGGVTIHPGGYTLSPRALKGKDEILAKSLRTIVRQRQQVDPMIQPRPSIRFLVEPGGAEVYRDARRQTFVSGLDWPTVLQVADTRVLDFLPRERF